MVGGHKKKKAGIEEKGGEKMKRSEGGESAVPHVRGDKEEGEVLQEVKKEEVREAEINYKGREGHIFKYRSLEVPSLS